MAHEDFTSVCISTRDVLEGTDHSRIHEKEKLIGYGGIGTLGTAAMGGGLVVGALRTSRGLPATLGMTIGGGFLAAASVLAGVGMIRGTLRPDAFEGADALTREINAAR